MEGCGHKWFYVHYPQQFTPEYQHEFGVSIAHDRVWYPVKSHNFLKE